MATRAEFIGRIRREVGKTAGLFTARTAPRPARPAEAAELVKRQMAERWPQALDRFREEFERVAGVFHRAATRDEVSAIILAIARERSARGVVAWDPASLGLDLGPALGAAGLSLEAMGAAEVGEAARHRHRASAARSDLGVTGVDFALAETGTLILLSGAGRPRSTSLLPATHVAVFDRRRLLESLEQVGVVLEALHVDPSRSMSGAVINFITGPSRTADIELTLTRGVHGPKEVHAVFVDEPVSAETPW
ncbi:MAG TPA: lactate utilization protein [Candidatus Methylomirabilis sp.]|nr:lactate utilization protein [Candidatus Methylomirabilis sp.]